MTIEYRCTCNRCHHAWCFNDSDLKENKRRKLGAGLNLLNSAISAYDHKNLGAMAGANVAANYSNGIIDYSQCPNCGSINIAVQTLQL